MLREASTNARLGPITLHRFRSKARRPHEPRDATSTARPARSQQRLMKMWTAVALVMEHEESNNLRGQFSILVHVRTVLALPPRIEPARGDGVAATERSDVKAFGVRDEVVDEGEPVAFRALQNRMAFFRSSCSSCNCAYLRSSAWS
jgi:hypothetical protein